MNTEQARFNMVEQQIRPWEVLDQDVLDLLYVVRREEFVPEAYRALAFADLEIPLYENAPEGERMMLPKLEARILQALAVTKSERVLEVGTGSGYLTALLAACAHHVYSVRSIPDSRRPGKLRRAGVKLATEPATHRGDGKDAPTTSSSDGLDAVRHGSCPAQAEDTVRRGNPGHGGELIARVSEACRTTGLFGTSRHSGTHRVISLRF
jgi:protein-L-isoaspartate(D-aspartate) O-methyltransferase